MAPWTLLSAVAVVTAGCNAFDGLRSFFHSQPEAKASGLHIDVDPPDGLSILLDGLQVGTLAPFDASDLTPGNHLLVVRARGYYPFTLPLDLTPGETLRLTVSLRPRPPGEEEPPEEVAAPAPKEPETPEIPPVSLVLKPKPKVPVLLDGTVARRGAMTLIHAEGEISVGVMKIGYRSAGAGYMELILPGEKARWWVDGKPALPSAAVAIQPGSVSLRRVGQDGTDQSVVITRR